MSRDDSAFPHPLYDKYVLQPFYEDAKAYYYAPMLAANRAHVVMLHIAATSSPKPMPRRCLRLCGKSSRSASMR